MAKGDRLFRYPVFGLSGEVRKKVKGLNFTLKFPQVIWRGCFCTPYTALAALMEVDQKNPKHTTPEEDKQELCSLFQASIQRQSTGDKDLDQLIETELPHISIVPAPKCSILKDFGGVETPDSYRKLYDPGFKLSKPVSIASRIYVQQLPNADKVDGALPPDADDITVVYKHSEIIAGGSAQTLVSIPQDVPCTDEALENLKDETKSLPRNFAGVMMSCLDLVRQIREPGSEPVNPDSFCVYVHPEKKGVFAIGDPTAFGPRGQRNKLVSRLFSTKKKSRLVLGDVVIISKKGLASLRKKKKQAAKENKAEESADSDEVMAEPQAKVKPQKNEKKEKKRSKSPSPLEKAEKAHADAKADVQEPPIKKQKITKVAAKKSASLPITNDV